MERYKRFDELLVQIKALHDSKGQDYEGNGRPYENIRAGEPWGIEPWKYAMLRCSEKMRRLQTFSTTGSLNNESAFDSLIDIAVLSLIAYVLLEETHAHDEQALAGRDGTVSAGCEEVQA